MNDKLKPKKINMPMEYIQIKGDEELFLDTTFERKLAFEIAESFDNKIYEKVIEIAKEKGYTDLVLINKEFVVEAFKREIERRRKENNER